MYQHYFSLFAAIVLTVSSLTDIVIDAIDWLSSDIVAHAAFLSSIARKNAIAMDGGPWFLDGISQAFHVLSGVPLASQASRTVLKPALALISFRASFFSLMQSSSFLQNILRSLAIFVNLFASGGHWLQQIHATLNVGPESYDFIFQAGDAMLFVAENDYFVIYS